jgi:hypothetical protein
MSNNGLLTIYFTYTDLDFLSVVSCTILNAFPNSTGGDGLMINVWLDDVRPAPDGWVWAKDATDCLMVLTRNIGNVDMLSLDHDLGLANTGYDVAKGIVEYPELFPRRIYLHTSNPVGRDNMYQLFSRYIEVHELDIKLSKNPLWIAWEQSMEKAKELGLY